MLILIIFIIIGFVFAKVLSGKKEGEEGIVKSLKITLGDYILHVHHWLWSLLIIFILLLIHYYNDFLYGLLI